MSISQSAVSNPISTHAPAGGATGQRRDAVVGKIDFYSRPCGRGDRSTAIIRSRCTYFYSRPCGRGDAQTAGVSAVSTYFYSRPCGRGDGRILLRIGKLENFYSRPCGRGDVGQAQGDGQGNLISTHAPAGGATWASSQMRTNICGFLLTPLREGRLKDQFGMDASLSDFYSRPCGRGDYSAAGKEIPTIGTISTHAPAGGATNLRVRMMPTIRVFLLTPLREGRPAPPSTPKPVHTPFLLTPLREGRHYSADQLFANDLFLLTPLREGRLELWPLPVHWVQIFLLTPLREGRPKATRNPCIPIHKISTHAPAGGATVASGKGRICGGQISTHAPAGGATCAASSRVIPTVGISTHAPAGGATPGCDQKIRPDAISTHAPAGGATVWNWQVQKFGHISTHAPAGGATACFIRRSCRRA